MSRGRCLPILLLALPGALPAQLISIRTVPVAQSDQFDIYPSHNLALGGISFALPDSLRDPFVNPATGIRVTQARIVGSPLLFSVTGDAGAGRTLPLSAQGRVGAWFGAASFALQEVDPSNRTASPIQIQRFDLIAPVPDLQPPGRSRGNEYAFVSLGRSLGAGVSVAVSTRWAGLQMVDGVDLLYAGSSQIVQAGHAGDVRLGLLKEWADDRALEVLVLHNRFRMRHDVTFLDAFWDPATMQTRQRSREERNLDYSDAWGLHLAYSRPLREGWRVGAIGTANLMSHPKLPNYDVRSVGIVPIPWDPGSSQALNVGLGFVKVRERSTFGIEAVYEPIWTYTWGEAPGPIPTQAGGTIPTGGKTVENWFRFSNKQFRMGVERRNLPALGQDLSLQLGLMIHSIRYRLNQRDNVQDSWRNLNEGWVEWAPTWGLTLRLPDMEIRYRGRVTNGTGRPGESLNFGRGGGLDFAAAESAGSNILVAPNSPLTLGEVSVFNHQVSVSIPLR